MRYCTYNENTNIVLLLIQYSFTNNYIKIRYYINIIYYFLPSTIDNKCKKKNEKQQ